MLENTVMCRRHSSSTIPELYVANRAGRDLVMLEEGRLGKALTVRKMEFLICFLILRAGSQN